MSRTTELTMRLRADARFTDDALVLPSGRMPLPALGSGLAAAVAELAAGDRTESAVAATVTERAGVAGLMQWHGLLRRLDAAAVLERAVSVDGGELARLRPVGRAAVGWAGASARGTVKLSRFATLRAADGVLAASHPRSPVVVALRPDLLGPLLDWVDADGFAAAADLPGAAATAVLRLLSAAGLLVVRDADGADPEDDARHAGWAPHDLWLHARSRGSRLSTGYGGTYPLAGVPAPPAVPSARDGQRIRCVEPDLAAAAKTDPSLTEVLERRRSIRRHDAARPLTVDQLGELLYRAARVRRTFSGADGQELVDRPYPSGGSLGELELYPLVNECAGLPPGLWHYASADHAFELVAEPGPATRSLTAAARSASTMDTDPQVVLVVAARFGRVQWKYETMAYALTLKHVGVLYHSLYLVGTAMGLAVCGLGGGDAEHFAAASGLDYLTEGSVGELVLGSALPEDLA
jgi:SagB-type dehydrogenase family enzyme